MRASEPPWAMIAAMAVAALFLVAVTLSLSPAWLWD